MVFTAKAGFVCHEGAEGFSQRNTKGFRSALFCREGFTDTRIETLGRGRPKRYVTSFNTKYIPKIIIGISPARDDSLHNCGFQSTVHRGSYKTAPSDLISVAAICINPYLPIFASC